MKEIEWLISSLTLPDCLELYHQFSVTAQWSVLYNIFKTNVEPTNLGYCTILYHTVYFFMQLGFSLSNWQKVQLNDDLFSDTQKCLYTRGLAWLYLD